MGISQIRALLCCVPKGCSSKHTRCCPCRRAGSLQELLVSPEPSCEPSCWETPRLVKAKACQQCEQPASSSKDSHRLGITRVLCPGTEHLFLETGATRVSRRPNQVSLPGLFPGTSATSFQARAQLLPAGGIPKPNSFLALSLRATHS